MKDRLPYLIIGVLIGIVVMQWGVNSQPSITTQLIASPIGSNYLNGSGILAIVYQDVLDENGQVWRLSGSEEACWTRLSDWDVPVQVDQIKLWSQLLLITNENIAWRNTNGTWVNCGPWPGASVPAEQSTLGEIKNKIK